MKRRNFIGLFAGLFTVPFLAKGKPEKYSSYIKVQNNEVTAGDSDGGYLLPPDVTKKILYTVNEYKTKHKQYKIVEPTQEFKQFMRDVKRSYKN